MKEQVRIGIDPGVKTGYARSVNRKLVELKCLDFWDAYDEILKHDPADIFLVSVEVSNVSHVWHQKKNIRSAAKVGQHVGAVRREGELLVLRLVALGYAVRAVNPRGKINSDRFKKITGWEGRTNEHTRDAGMLSIR